MAYLNKCFLIGNLTRYPELRVTPKGTSIAAFGLAINRDASRKPLFLDSIEPGDPKGLDPRIACGILCMVEADSLEANTMMRHGGREDGDHTQETWLDSVSL